MSIKKSHRDIRLPVWPPKEIPHIVKVLVEVLNKRRMNVRSFAIAEKISPSKVYNWFTGKSQPKRESLDVIYRFFKKIHFKYNPNVPADPGNMVEEASATYLPGGLHDTNKALDSQSLKVVMKDIQIAIRLQSEQNEFMKYHLLRLTDKLNFLSGDVKTIYDYLAERHRGRTDE